MRKQSGSETLYHLYSHGDLNPKIRSKKSKEKQKKKKCLK